MTKPTEPPDDDWWHHPINRREKLWLGISGVWSLGIFAWMAGFTEFGDQNPVGETVKVTPEEYEASVEEYEEAAGEGEDGLIPPSGDVYIGAHRFDWDGLPVELEAGTEYQIHLGSYDVQHGFSVRPEASLSQQMNLQIFPDREWIVPMTFEDPGRYRVICTEFCGVGHNGMNGAFVVK